MILLSNLNDFRQINCKLFECDWLVFDPSIRFLATAHLIYVIWMSTAIPRRKYPVSLAPGSQATSGPVSTWMGDRLGIPGAVDFFLFFMRVILKIIILYRDWNYLFV